jgi:GTP-binding protein
MDNKKLEPWTADFLGSFVEIHSLPLKYPAIAVIGRSNVGKSSFINSIIGQKGLARVSATPGKTQQLNLFLVQSSFYLVDMPGYGYARISKQMRETWSSWTKEVLLNYSSLLLTLILVDANISFQQNDNEFISWCGENQVPFAIIRTKSDKSKAYQIESLELEMRQALELAWEELPTIFRHSSVTKTGIEPIRQYLSHVIQTHTR